MWECFWLEPTGRETRSLRRLSFHAQPPCPLRETGFHNAAVRIADGPARLTEPDERGARYHRSDPSGFELDHRWPTHCQCGYEFGPYDTRQINGRLIYQRADGAWWPFDQIPIGGMIEADWMHGLPAWCGPDGRSLMVKLPPGAEHDWWLIDGPAGNGAGWARTGEPPVLSVTPSISTPRYHSFLGSTNAPPGWLGDPL